MFSSAELLFCFVFWNGACIHASANCIKQLQAASHSFQTASKDAMQHKYSHHPEKEEEAILKGPGDHWAKRSALSLDRASTSIDQGQCPPLRFSFFLKSSSVSDPAKWACVFFRGYLSLLGFKGKPKGQPQFLLSSKSPFLRPRCIPSRCPSRPGCFTS